MKRHFADRLVEAVLTKKSACVVGLDPRLEEIPRFITSRHFVQGHDRWAAVRDSIVDFHRMVLREVADLVPAVKPQLAFYEQYGLAGMEAFSKTVRLAREMGLIVIADAKRNDISSTAAAYANAFLGGTVVQGKEEPVFDADCITVSPYLGADSLEPFIDVCRAYGKGIFVLVKTSNPGSASLQDLVLADEGIPIYLKVAQMVERYAGDLVGATGYSSVGAVVGATYPDQADVLRRAMPRSIFLVPGYGAQGATGHDAAHSFNPDGLGAIVNASRSITYGFKSLDISEQECAALIRQRTISMVRDVNEAVAARSGSTVDPA